MDLPRPFGPYTLLRRLAVGGMAEVYVAKTMGLGGFEKLVGIKVIHPRYSEDEHFVQMLVEEAKLSVLLTHVNIAQTFDLGCIDDTYFIVMELVEGADAYKLLQRAAEHRTPLPIDVCAYVAAEMCNALDYAHRKKDVSGQPLHIVHRDISPQNVLISFAGEVKIVDFGIAKAAMRSGQTEVGVIKGKYYYMSPEQAWADPIDHRSDVFSTGIVLHELLTGRMLYQEENLPRLLDRVRKADVAPPSRSRPEVPPELDAIVNKALAKHATDRYGSAHELSQALSHFLFRVNPTFTPARVSGLMAQLFPKELTQATGSYRLPSGEHAMGSTGVGKTTDSLAPMKRPVEYRPDLKKSVIFDLAEFDDESTSRQIPKKRGAPPPRQDEDEDDYTVVEGRPRIGSSPPPETEAANPDAADDWDETTVAVRPKLAVAGLTELQDDEGWGDATLVDEAGEAALRMREALARQVAAKNAQRATSSEIVLPPQERELPERPVPKAAPQVPPRAPQVAQPPQVPQVPQVPQPPQVPQAPQPPQVLRGARVSAPSPSPRVERPAPAALPPSPLAGPRTVPAATWPTEPWPTPNALPDLSRDPWGDPTGTPAPPLGSDPFVVRPVESTMKLAAVTDVVRSTWIRWAIATALVLLALGGGLLTRELMRETLVEGTLEVVSRPSGARVVLDGRELPGRTPIVGIEHLVVGRALSLEVLLEEHEPWRGDVTPVAGTLQKVAVLVPLRRDVVVESSPPGGQVWIDGVLHGALPRRLEDLAHGRTLELRVSWPRGPTVQRTLRVDASTPERLVLEAP